MFLVVVVVVADRHQVILRVFQEHLLLFDNLLNETKRNFYANQNWKHFYLHDKVQPDI